MKKKRYETEHESNLGTAALGGVTAAVVSVIYGIYCLIKGESVGRALSGAAVCAFIFLLLTAYYLIDWAIDVRRKKRIMQQGTVHDAVITSEHEIRKGGKSGGRLVWKYSVKLEDNTVLTSQAYTERIPYRRCTAYVLGEDCVLTEFRSL